VDDAPAGFLYYPDILRVDEETALAARVRNIEFSAVEMRGQIARRRTAHFGWIYGYESWRITPGPPIPKFLGSVRRRAAQLAGISPEALVEVLVNAYPAGAGIGWHRDAPQFGVVIGVSLLSECRLRFQLGRGAARQTAALTIAPRSAYVLDGDAREEWQHCVPPTKALRYSVTFRTLRARTAVARTEPLGDESASGETERRGR
jgi:DNA oxidative demethylase